MKKLMLFAAVIFLAACVDKKFVNEFTLTGSVSNSPEGFIVLSQRNEMDTIHLNEDGTFSFTKEIEKPGAFWLLSNNKYIPLYQAPDIELNIVFNAENVDATLTFEGALALENRFLQKEMNNNQEFSSFIYTLFEASPEEFLYGLDSIRGLADTFLEEYVASNDGMTENFVKNKKLAYRFSYYSYLLDYEAYHKHKYITKVEDVALPDDWYDFLDDIVIDNPEYLDDPYIMTVLGSIIQQKIIQAGGFGGDPKRYYLAFGTVELLEAQFNWVTENFKSQELIDHFLNDYINDRIDRVGPFGAEKFIEAFYEKTTKEENKKALTEKVEKWAYLSAGMPSPAFTLPDINGNMVSLSDFLGKYVYIEFWATWCGPCIKEIPYLEKLVEEYKDKNIEIISISVDQDKQAWIDKVTKDQPQWLQLHDSIMMKDDYLVKVANRFVLIDTAGKILNVSALRPSKGEKLKNLLNSLEHI